jgi:hypothetical protein
MVKRYYYHLTHVVYDTDYGFLFEDRIQENFYMHTSMSVDVDLKAPEIINPKPQLGSIDIRNTASSAFYFRTYIKLSLIIANVGGFIKFIMMVCNIIVYLLTNNMMLEEISKIIFSFDDGPSDSIKQIDIVKNKEKFSTLRLKGFVEKFFA